MPKEKGQKAQVPQPSPRALLLAQKIFALTAEVTLEEVQMGGKLPTVKEIALMIEAEYGRS